MIVPKTCLIALVTAYLLPAMAQVKIVDPEQGAYVSGRYEVVLVEAQPDEVVRTRLFLDEREVFAGSGFSAGVTVNFGEVIVAHELYAKLTYRNGDEVTSPTVRTRALEVNLETTTEVVLLTAVVKSKRNEALTGLTKRDFTVLENGRPLQIATFYSERLPLDLVFLLDTSSSLKAKGIETVKAAAASFLRQLDQADKIVLYEFKAESLKRSDFTNDRKLLLRHIEAIEARGETALFDTLLLGLGDLKGRQRGRKAVVLFTDGRDSVYEEPEDKARLLRQAITQAQNEEVSIFTVGLGKRVQQEAMARLSLETGGRFFEAEGVTDLDRIFSEIVSDLKSQYVLGVVPLSKGTGFQRLQVKVDKRSAQVFARSGFSR